MTGSGPLRRGAARRLRDAGVASPEWDADELLAHVLGTTRGGLLTVDAVSDEQAERFFALVSRRVGREPLQHITGTAAFRHVELAVGPGVFVPRPETELLAGWAIEHALGLDDPVVVDLCTGSGAIARAIADEVPSARVFAVELDEPAHDWAARNLAGTGVELRARRHGGRLRRPRRHRRRRSPATRPTSRSTPGSRSPPRPVTTTPSSPSSPETTGSTRCGCSSAGPPRCCRPGGVRRCRACGRPRTSRPRRSSRATGRWRRGDRPPRLGRSSALRDGPAGTMNPMEEALVSLCPADRTAPEERAEAVEAVAAPSARVGSWSCPPTPSTAWLPTLSSPTRSLGCSRPRDAAATCRRPC